jgi:hypothetical protein
MQQHIGCLLLSVKVSHISAIVMTETSLHKEHMQEQTPLLSVPNKLQRTKTRYNNDKQADGKLSHVLNICKQNVDGVREMLRFFSLTSV